MLTELLHFVKNHYELIISILLVLLSFILTLVKKKPSINLIDTIKEFILELLPTLIKTVEKPGQGSTKRNLVLKLIQEAVAKKFNFYDFASIEQWCSDQLEHILSTPSKKEEK